MFSDANTYKQKLVCKSAEGFVRLAPKQIMYAYVSVCVYIYIYIYFFF